MAQKVGYLVAVLWPLLFSGVPGRHGGGGCIGGPSSQRDNFVSFEAVFFPDKGELFDQRCRACGRLAPSLIPFFFSCTVLQHYDFMTQYWHVCGVSRQCEYRVFVPKQKLNPKASYECLLYFLLSFFARNAGE